MSENIEGAGTAPAPVTEPTPTPTPTFDFVSRDIGADAERGSVYNLRDPKSAQPLPVTLWLWGADARSYRQNLRRMQDEVAANLEKEPTDEDDAVVLGRARNAAAAVSAWEGVIVNGVTIEFSRENAVELFTKYAWAADQVLTFIGNRGNF